MGLVHNIAVEYDDKEKMILIQLKSVYFCHFCFTGFDIRENLFLHLMVIHDIEYDIVFKVAVRFSMLHRSKRLCCTRCPLTFLDDDVIYGHSIDLLT